MGSPTSKLNNYFSVIKGNIFLIFNYIQKANRPENVHLGIDENPLSIDGENRFFHIKLTLSNLHYPQFATETCLAIILKYYRFRLLLINTRLLAL